MRNTLYATTVLVLLSGALPAAASDAGEALERSIDYHDPNAVWHPGASIVLGITSTYSDDLAARVGYSERRDEVELDPGANAFRYESTRGEHRASIHQVGTELELAIDGDPDPPDDLAEKLSLQDGRRARLRDYLLFLYGLPMKLMDPGTILDPNVEATTLDGRPVIALRVTYDPDVGGDTWYFYLDPDDHRLVGCRFYHDEAAGDGEVIYFDGETVDADSGLRLPRRRAWYRHTDDAYLGTDEITVLRALPAEPGSH